MTGALDLTLLEPHAARLLAMAEAGDCDEQAAYMTFGTAEVACDPWGLGPRTRLVSHAFVDIEGEDRIGASPIHVTWSTAGYMRLLSASVGEGLVPAIVHTHPGSTAFFSDQDDANEAELARTAFLKGAKGLASLVLGGDGSLRARMWLPGGGIADAEAVRSTGGRFRCWPSSTRRADAPHLERQGRLFGPDFNELVQGLRVGVVGCGGTGSPTAMLLARLGVGYLVLLDDDVVEVTNLNRVHGSRMADAEAAVPKVDVLVREIDLAGLGTKVVPMRMWAGDPRARDALKSCDFVFGCTDDHSGRIMLNRLAYFYGVTVIDLGLRMAPATGGAHDMQGRVTTLSPGRPCLLCHGVVNARRAAEEALERSDPGEFARRKAEAYVIGGGDPAPAVVTFTTEMACVAVNEMVAALTGFHGGEGMIANRSRRFHARDERFLAAARERACPVCVSTSNWGRADVDPFLDMVG